jgi:hypothetical protein
LGTPNSRSTCSWDPLPQRHGFTLNGLGATALRAGAASHHACGREELLRCWTDSETRPQGSGSTPRPTTLAEGRSCFGVGPTRKPVLKGQALCALSKTERRACGLDSVARDNPADSLMPQDRWCSPYPHSTGPGPTRQGVGPAWGRTPACVAGSPFTWRDAQPSTGHLP